MNRPGLKEYFGDLVIHMGAKVEDNRVRMWQNCTFDLKDFVVVDDTEIFQIEVIEPALEEPYFNLKGRLVEPDGVTAGPLQDIVGSVQRARVIQVEIRRSGILTVICAMPAASAVQVGLAEKICHEKISGKEGLE